MSIITDIPKYHLTNDAKLLISEKILRRKWILGF
jgi:hypothetical protein